MDITTLALVTGLGWTSGIRFYAVVFFLGLLQHSGIYTLPAGLEMLAHPWVITISGLLFLTEFFADKIPGVDSAWDALHTFIRIPGGALLAAAAVAGGDPGLALAAGLLGGTVAAGAHLTKAGSRALINTSPEPFSNWTASFTEDALVLGALWAALKYPLLFLALLLLFILAALWLLPRLWRGLRRVAALFDGKRGAS
ncbi:MAG: DUF4126 domain-containing protein [Burkholderiales bacterium]